MKSLRIILSFAFALLSVFALVFAAFSMDKSSVQSTIDTSRQIETSFSQAAAFIDKRIKETGALPTAEEFKAWSDEFPPQPYTVNGMYLDRPPYATDLIAKYGRPPSNGYVLSYWRGEWEENYVSWTKQSSLVFDQSAYFLFGSSLAQTGVAIVVSISMLIVARKLWPRRQHAA